MSPDQINIALAEWEGWKWTGSPEQVAATAGFPMPHVWVIDPDGILRFRNDIPDYTDDLNAVHRLEEKLDNSQMQFFVETILLFNKGRWHKESSAWIYLTSTALQRCEALLRTIGKWKEEE